MSADGFVTFSSAPSPEELSAFDLNDYGNAMRLIRLAGGRFDPETGEIDLMSSTVLYLRHRGWIAFNGKNWDREHGEALAVRLANRVAQGLHAQMACRIAKQPEMTPRAMAALYDFALQSGNSGKISAMLKVAQFYLDVGIDDFDRNPRSLNVQNGTIRFRLDAHGSPFVDFSPVHDPADRITRICEANWNPKAPCPLFDGVVAFAQPKADMRHYMHMVLGYCATGSTSEQKFFIFQGKGGDGKSTIVGAVREALGSYATVAAIETFLDAGVRRGSEASPDIAALAGDTRLISAGEPPSGSKLAAGAIKQYTGGGKIKARELREGLFEFNPIGKPLIECNRRPTINDTDDGIWRRLKIILFRQQVPSAMVDGQLPEKLKKEADGILRWLVEGVLAWMTEGLKNDPADVRDAVDDYRRGSNPFAQWMTDRLVLDPDAVTGASELYRDYTQWMEDEGHDRPMTQKAFGGALGDLQIIMAGKGRDGKKRRRGARLKPKWVAGEGDGGFDAEPPVTPEAPAAVGEAAWDNDEDEDWAGR